MAAEAVRLHSAWHQKASTVLAHAFHDDPVFIDALPADEARRAALPEIMAMNVKIGRCHGEVLTTDNGIQGVAIWLPPGRPAITLWDLILFGGLGLPFQMGHRATGRLLRSLQTFEDMHARLMGRQPHWYLFLLGVDPPSQGRGIGSSLLAPILSQADAAGLPCYLETAKARNVPFYERLGFEIVHQDRVPGDGPKYWAMCRQPTA